MQSSGFHALTLIDKVCEYDEVYTFRFAPDSPVPFVPGQYVHLLAPQSPPGRENVRHLSIASGPQEGALQFTVDLSSNSDYKRKLRNLAPGGKAHLFKVKGHFVLPRPVPSLVFVAGGLGITPIRSLIQQLVAEGSNSPWRLLHVARSAHLYQNELVPLGGVQVRVARDGALPVLDAWVPELAGALWYVSGSHRFVVGMNDALGQRGVPPQRIVTEDFE